MTHKGGGDFSIGSHVWAGVSKLIEEMGELQQVLGKLMGTAGETKHWDGSDLRERLKEELGDVLAAIDFFQARNFTKDEDATVEARRDSKRKIFFEWHDANVKKTPEALVRALRDLADARLGWQQTIKELEMERSHRHQEVAELKAKCAVPSDIYEYMRLFVEADIERGRLASMARRFAVVLEPLLALPAVVSVLKNADATVHVAELLRDVPRV